MYYTLIRLSIMRTEMQLICKHKADTENTFVSAYFIGKDGN